MGKTIFEDIYILSKKLSMYLPLSEGLQLGQMEAVLTENSVAEGEHWAIAGRTGTGKTTLVKALIRAHQRRWPWLNVYHLDSKKKGDFTKKDGPIIMSYDPPPPLTGVGKVQIWQPVVDDLDAYDQYFMGILETGIPAVVNIDESKNLRIGNRVPRGFELLLSQGRRPGIHTLTNMQEIAKAPRQAISQPSHIIAFNLWNTWDEMTMKHMMRIRERGPLPLAGKFSLLYLRPDHDATPHLFHNYRELINFWHET